jgi:hypothetical protein
LQFQQKDPEHIASPCTWLVHKFLLSRILPQRQPKPRQWRLPSISVLKDSAVSEAKICRYTTLMRLP